MSNTLIKALKAVNFLSGTTGTPAELKRHRKLAEWAGRLATPKDDTVRGRFRVGRIPCEEIRPVNAHNPKYAILYCHGGGYVSGGLGYAGNLASKLAIATGFTVYSFAYRLAPEHPYPAAHEDALAVWNCLAEHGFAADRVFLAGDSAGANLALCLTQKLIADKQAAPRELLLFSPWVDLTGTAESYGRKQVEDPILTGAFVADSAGAYLGDGDPADPAFSPIYGSFEGFPPVYIMAGKNGILLDDSIRLREKIGAAGGTAWLDIEEKGWHVYQQMPIPMARRAMQRLAAHVSGQVYGSGISLCAETPAYAAGEETDKESKGEKAAPGAPGQSSEELHGK